jgi:hypothetical protein
MPTQQIPTQGFDSHTMMEALKAKLNGDEISAPEESAGSDDVDMISATGVPYQCDLPAVSLATIACLQMVDSPYTKDDTQPTFRDVCVGIYIIINGAAAMAPIFAAKRTESALSRQQDTANSADRYELYLAAIARTHEVFGAFETAAVTWWNEHIPIRETRDIAEAANAAVSDFYLAFNRMPAPDTPSDEDEKKTA